MATPEDCNVDDVARIIDDLHRGRLGAAAHACTDLLESSPGNPDANHLMGRITLAQGDVKSAAAWYAIAAERRPDVGEFQHDLAVVLSRLGRTAEAVDAFQRAVELNPTGFGPTMNLARELERSERPAQAEAMARRALSLKPESSEAHLILGSALAKQNRWHEALAALAAASQCKTADPVRALSATAMVLEELGRTPEAIDAHRRALAAGGSAAWLHSNYLYSLRYSDAEERNPTAVFREHAGWAAQFARPLYHSLQPPENDRTPDRKLRIGYVSADFRRHSASNGMDPLVRHHDRSAFEVWCYDDSPSVDDVTERFRAAADKWRRVRGLGDEQVARMIREDRIDVLVDHTGHMGGNRLMVFARRPAPVQVAFPGYPGTTGLETIDAFITDACQDPPGETEPFYAEKLVRLAGSPRCYAAPAGAPEPGPLPADENGGAVTFAVLQRPAKLTDRMFGLWARVLNATPKSRFVMLLSHAAPGELEREFTPRLRRHQIDPARVELVGRLPGPKY